MADGVNILDKSALESVRQKLDAGLGDKLIGKYRALAAATDNSWNEHEAKYKVIILGALLMGTGAKSETTTFNISVSSLPRFNATRTSQSPLLIQGFEVRVKGSFSPPWTITRPELHAVTTSQVAVRENRPLLFPPSLPHGRS